MSTHIFDPVTLVFDLHSENFNHVYIFFYSIYEDFDILNEFLLWQILSVGINRFDLVTLTFMFFIRFTFSKALT
jgi:hypothetical protein